MDFHSAKTLLEKALAQTLANAFSSASSEMFDDVEVVLIDHVSETGVHVCVFNARNTAFGVSSSMPFNLTDLSEQMSAPGYAENEVMTSITQEMKHVMMMAITQPSAFVTPVLSSSSEMGFSTAAAPAA